MSRHRNVKWDMDEEDQYEDYEQDPEDDPDYYISLILEKLGIGVSPEQAEQALEECDWDVEKAIKQLRGMHIFYFRP